MAKNPKILTGIAGEYYVAAELTKKGYIASITLRNTEGIDILVSNQKSTKSLGIQVKTSNQNASAWMLKSNAETYKSDSLYYIFVKIKKEDVRPDFFIVPSKIVASYIKRKHIEWMKKPSRIGKKHVDSSMRIFRDPKNKYLEKWDLLKL